jgi:hypothetical protein
MRRKVAIISEFVDYYDHAFDSILFHHDIVWERSIRNGIKRRDIFKALDNVGLLTPLHGEVDKIVPLLLKDDNDKEVVIYTDEYAHCGTGKIKLPAKAAMEWAGCYCSEYIKPQTKNAVSFRILRIGIKCWLLKYTGINSWMSNSAEDVNIELISELDNVKTVMRNSPMLAIDYVLDGNMPQYIDINTAPGLKWTGLEDVLHPSDVYKLVVDYYENLSNKEDEFDREHP